MQDRTSARTQTFGIAAALMPSLVLCLLVIGAGRVEAAGTPAKRTCSTAGLRFSDRRAGVTFSVAEADLRAQAIGCTAARSVAFTVRGGV